MSQDKKKELETESQIVDNHEDGELKDVVPVSGMYKNWFLDYASYVILERAVPAIEDGFKPVQRRILHSMKEMDDGRFNKVANIIGHTMQYHPHGDAAIGDATVNLGQKDLLIETQGNWGDIRTGDSSAAPRYIEARLSKFALEVSFNKQTTNWQASYDGRKKEPIHLPVKFPMILAQGVEGIAVGLSTKIMPHNFCELIEASINALRKRKVELFPDFPTGGLIDVSNYNEGKRGGKIRVRAKIEVLDKKTLIIKEMPYGITVSSLVDSILKANDQGKIKIKKVVDNTAKNVEVLVSLAPGTSPDMTMSALYAFTNCEVSISPNACVIIEEKPHFMSVNDLLKISTIHTVDLLKWELEIKQKELEERWHFSSLEKIFIENRIYRDIEECETWEAVLESIDSGLNPFKKLFKREITQDDIIRLTEIKIKRISKYDAFKADELIKKIEADLEEVKHHLANLTQYAVDYFRSLLKKYGAEKERKTEIRTFDTIKATNVVIANEKLFVNRKEGFIGYGMKKDEFVEECSDLDDVIAFRKDGKFMVTRISDKKFVGKNIIHCAVWKKGDERTTYHFIYFDGKSGISYAKRFNVNSITRDKPYDLTKGTPNSKLHYFKVHANSESEIVNVMLSPNSRARKKVFDFDFGELAIKGRGSMGNILTKYGVKKISQKSVGFSTLGGLPIWYDDILGRLNKDERGRFLGEFEGNDAILAIYKDGTYRLSNFDLTNRYDANEILVLEKFNPEKVISAVHYAASHQSHYVKRFLIETTTLDKKFPFIQENKNSKLLFATTHSNPKIELATGTKRKKVKKEYLLNDFVAVKGWKAIGNKIADKQILNIIQLDSKEIIDKKNKSKKVEIQKKEKTSSEKKQLDLF